MADVSRAEFDALAGRVASLERALGNRLDGIDTKLDQYTAQVNQAIRAFTTTAEQQGRTLDAIAAHLGIDD
jgi:hypothetical protein